MAGKHRHYRLLEDRDVNLWYGNVAEGSKITADTSLRRLGLFCEFVGKSPKDLLSLSEREINDLLMEFVRDFRNVSDEKGDGKQHSGTYMAAMIKPVRSWLSFNNIAITRKVKIAGQNSRPSLKNERVPTQEELRNIFLAGDARERLACAMMAFTGMRPQVLGNYRGTDGLRISDIKDIGVGKDGVEILKEPVRIVIRSELSKKENEYFSFLGPEGVKYLKLYIEERMKQGETIHENSPVIAPAKKGIRDSVLFISTTNIGDLIRGPIRRSGLNQRPYVLRKYFDTQLLQAESKTGLRRDYRVFWMGHTGDMEHEYTLNHGILPDALIEDMRSAYARSLKFLETEEHAMKEEDYVKQLRESAIMAIEVMAGISFSDEEKEKLFSASSEEFQERLRDLAKDRQAMALNNGNRHKTISEGDLEEYLNSGWELVQIYPRGDKAVVRLP